MADYIETSFWKFLVDKNIEIPIIQRDYAQGRIGKEKLREKFLKDLKEVLDLRLADPESRDLKLDFVYGTDVDSTVNPLDGQQRLTTLWLLHWYIANKAGKLTENNENFKKFTYKTRVTSREFCNKLVDFELETNDKVVVDAIENQTWFYSAWKQDPTIQAMLNMLGGTTLKDAKKNEIIDGIEELFDNNCKFEKYWELLTADNCPIKFHYLPLDELKLSDDLYIKMNARGKALTPFENFKADLVRHIETLNFDKGKSPQDTFAHKLDTDWTDLFWKFKSKDHKIDDIYFAFFNRFFLNELITAKTKKENEKSDYIFKGEDFEKNNKTFQSLLKDEQSYTDFAIYCPKNVIEQEVFGIETFERLSKIFDHFKKSDNTNLLLLPHWDKTPNFKFIPEYKEDGTIDKITQVQRVVFYAICRYFEKGEYKENDKSLEQWVRVVWNIVENSNAESGMIGAMRLIDELAEGAADIYEFLKEKKTDIKSDFAEEQMKEEIQKAIQIKNDSSGEWERKIIEAEQHAFFKGAIRFLFRTVVDTYDWSKFDSRFEKTKEYFVAKGVKDEYKTDIITALVRNISDWNKIYESTIFSTTADSCKRLLTGTTYFEDVNKILDSVELHSIPPKKLKEIKYQTIKDQLLQDGVIKFIIEDNYWKESRINEYYGIIRLYPKGYQTKIFLTTFNETLCKLLKNNNIIETKQKIDGDNVLFIGEDIVFNLVSDKNLKFSFSQWHNKLRKWDEVNNQFDDIKGTNENLIPITIDNLEEYLTTLNKKD
jgi:hypothetical protein